MEEQKREMAIAGLHEITDACNMLIDVIAKLAKGVGMILKALEE